MPSAKLRNLYINAAPDHSGHAECLIATHPNKFKYTDTHGWFVYNGKFWDNESGKVKVIQSIREVLRERQKIAGQRNDKKLENKSCADQWTINGVLGVLQTWPDIYATIDDFDDYHHLLNCDNGVLDLESMRLSSHSPMDSFTYCLPIKYDPDADQTEWTYFLRNCGLSNEILDFLQEFFGYCLTGATSEEILLYFRGKSRSGKGVITETFLELMGPLGQGVNFRMFTTDRGADTQNFDMAPLKGKRFIVAGEQNRKDGLNEATVKMITGGDSIYCAFKHKNHFSYRPQYKVVLTSNHMAWADPADEAVWGRLRIVPFEKSFLGKEDKTLKARLKEPENIQGVLAWAVAGAYRWYTNGMSYPKIMKDELDKSRSSASTVIAFVEDECKFDPAGMVEVTTLYDNYKTYCAAEGYGSLGRPRFKEEIATIYKISEERKRLIPNGKLKRVFTGILKV
jgi:putative DNA primase/helicase